MKRNGDRKASIRKARNSVAVSSKHGFSTYTLAFYTVLVSKCTLLSSKGLKLDDLRIMIIFLPPKNLTAVD